MKLILAQGNPGAQYDGTRHNAGFRMIDEYASDLGASWAEKPKFFATLAEVSVDGEKVILVKPTTFYNETGRAARALVDFYKLDPTTEFLVLHDELALPVGTIRTRGSGSDAGNNGVKSLNAALGPDYERVRIGIWNERRDSMDDTAFVLGKFDAEERSLLDAAYPDIRQHLQDFLKGKHEPKTIKVE